MPVGDKRLPSEDLDRDRSCADHVLTARGVSNGEEGENWFKLLFESCDALLRFRCKEESLLAACSRSGLFDDQGKGDGG